MDHAVALAFAGPGDRGGQRRCNQVIPSVQLGSPRATSVRLARAGVFALAGTGLGVAAHRLGGGMTPPLWLTTSAGLGLFALALAFTGSQRRLPTITGLVLTTQTVMHVGFTAIGMRRMAAPATAGERSLLSMVLCRSPARAPSSHELHAARATLASLHASAAPAVTHAAAPPDSMLTPSMAWMLTAHLLAATALAWWLARGERAVWRCARRVVRTMQAVAEGLPEISVTSPDRTVRRAAVTLRARWRELCAPGRAPPSPTFFSLRPAVA